MHRENSDTEEGVAGGRRVAAVATVRFVSINESLLQGTERRHSSPGASWVGGKGTSTRSATPSMSSVNIEPVSAGRGATRYTAGEL